MKAREKRRRFTLIELLVVIAIIAILASMLLPVLSRARDMAKRSVCMGNLKQIGLGMLMYAEDYDDYFPMYSAGQGWANYSSPYPTNIVYAWDNFHSGGLSQPSGLGFLVDEYLGGDGKILYCSSNDLTTMDEASFGEWWGTTLPTSGNFWDTYRICSYNYRNQAFNGDGWNTPLQGPASMSASLRSYDNTGSKALVADTSEYYERPDGAWIQADGTLRGKLITTPHGAKFANVLQIDGSGIPWSLPKNNVWMVTWFYARGGRAGYPTYPEYMIGSNDSGAEFFYWAFDVSDGDGSPVDWSDFAK